MSIQAFGPFFNTKPFPKKYTCTHIFVAALFTIAKTWKQPKYPSTDDWIRKMLYIHNGILVSHKKIQNNAICSNLDGTRESYTE